MIDDQDDDVYGSWLRQFGKSRNPHRPPKVSSKHTKESFGPKAVAADEQVFEDSDRYWITAEDKAVADALVDE